MQEIVQYDGSIIEFDEVQQQKLEDFAKLVKSWNGLSLIAKSTEEDIFGWHFEDGLSLYKLFEEYTKKNDESYNIVIDFGAGGGVLGVPLILAGVENIYLVERSKTKLMFIKDIAKCTKAFLNVEEACWDALDELAQQKEKNGIIKKKIKICMLVRGVDKVDSMLDLFYTTIEEVKTNLRKARTAAIASGQETFDDVDIELGSVVFLKSDNVQFELRKAFYKWSVEFAQFKRRSNARGSILIVKNIVKRNA